MQVALLIFKKLPPDQVESKPLCLSIVWTLKPFLAAEKGHFVLKNNNGIFVLRYPFGYSM